MSQNKFYPFFGHLAEDAVEEAELADVAERVDNLLRFDVDGHGAAGAAHHQHAKDQNEQLDGFWKEENQRKVGQVDVLQVLDVFKGFLAKDRLPDIVESLASCAGDHLFQRLDELSCSVEELVGVLQEKIVPLVEVHAQHIFECGEVKAVHPRLLLDQRHLLLIQGDFLQDGIDRPPN